MKILLALSLAVPASADTLQEAAAAAAQAASAGAAAARAAAQKPDPLAFDLSRAPKEVGEAVDARAEVLGRLTKSELRLELARFENAVEETFPAQGGCDARLDAALAKHAAGRAQAVADMTEIHAVLVGLRDAIAAGIAAETGYMSISAYSKRATAAADAQERAGNYSFRANVAALVRGQVENKFESEIAAARAELERLAAAKGLNVVRASGMDKLEVWVNLGGGKAQLELNTPLYVNSAAKMRYHAFITRDMHSSASSGDSLFEAFPAGSKASGEVMYSAGEYASFTIEDCVRLAAAKRAFAAK